jgi:aerobic carbon-monoxide dehydrogenase large subunit
MFGLPIDEIEIVHGDTAKSPFGLGTYGSRSAAVGGSAISKAADKVIAKGKKIAAALLEAAELDIEFTNGRFTVAGTDRAKTFGEIAFAAYNPPDAYPLETLEPGLEETAFYDPVNFTYPGGCHIAEVEIDPETGELELVGYTAVDDIGTVLNPMIVEGQIHGGVVQGIGQALFENCVYDSETGQLLTGSFMDYAMPRATDIPVIISESASTACTHNPIGVKGCGECGTIASPAAVINAVIDALSPYDVVHIDMPATPQKIWEAINAASQQRSA